ncbi:MAG: YraN family protein [Treponema sp.]|nr:YraN family protein [Treponema sp.]MCL2272562.1 YraN family protein [Treponema sp.]
MNSNVPVCRNPGKKGEDQAAAWLENAGMEIISRNFRSRFGEIDIIAREEETIVFLEVKTWSFYGLEDLQHSINTGKQRRIIKTAKFFLSENRKYSRMAIRFDVIFIKDAKTPAGFNGFPITHLASAFTEQML